MFMFSKLFKNILTKPFHVIKYQVIKDIVNPTWANPSDINDEIGTLPLASDEYLSLHQEISKNCIFISIYIYIYMIINT